MGYRLCGSPDKDLDIDALLQEAIGVCRRFKVPISNHVLPHMEICSRKDFYAVTERLRHNRFRITVSTTAFKDFKRDGKKWMSLLLHELCHTIRGCYNHRAKWKSWRGRLIDCGQPVL